MMCDGDGLDTAWDVDGEMWVWACEGCDRCTP
jgi:hypothetical protein